ncbi:MAG: hypothetical protein NTZ48_02595, partial [Candidatus Omnitrophica bacterium]|nr:hypothetical protein [Candidatus Omnitrophota bacterium]
ACEVIEAQALWDAKVATKLQEDFMSTDIICSSDLTPYIMELNDHYTGAMWNLDNVGGEIGRSSRDWVLTMIRRGLQYKQSLTDDEK